MAKDRLTEPTVEQKRECIDWFLKTNLLWATRELDEWAEQAKQGDHWSIRQYEYYKHYCSAVQHLIALNQQSGKRLRAKRTKTDA